MSGNLHLAPPGTPGTHFVRGASGELYNISNPTGGTNTNLANLVNQIMAQPEERRSWDSLGSQAQVFNAPAAGAPAAPRPAPAPAAPPPAPIAQPTQPINRPVGTSMINWQSLAPRAPNMGQTFPQNTAQPTMPGTMNRPSMQPTQTVGPMGLIASQMQPSSSTAQVPQFTPQQNPSYVSNVDLERMNRGQQGSVLDRFGVYNPYSTPQRG